jgi:hypothetical protein
MHPRIHEQMANQRMEELQREAVTMQHLNRANNDADNRTGSHSFTPILWYLLIGLRIPTFSQKQSAIKEEYTLGKLQARLNATTRVVGLAALGLGLLIGGFLNSSFGLVPIVLLGAIALVAVSFPILMRSVWMLRKHVRMPLQR